MSSICFIQIRGFGAKFEGVINHNFQCGSKDEVDGVDGILQAYRNTFKSGLVMSGPTDISEIILESGDRANSRQVIRHKHVLDYLMDHAITMSLISFAEKC